MLVNTATVSSVVDLANTKIASLSSFVSKRIRSGRYRGIQDELRLIKELHQGVEYLNDSTNTADNKTTVISYLYTIGNLHNISTNPYTI